MLSTFSHFVKLNISFLFYISRLLSFFFERTTHILNDRNGNIITQRKLSAYRACCAQKGEIWLLPMLSGPCGIANSECLNVDVSWNFFKQFPWIYGTVNSILFCRFTLSYLFQVN